MRNQYAKRRQALVCALQAAFGDQCAVCGDAAGLNLAASFAGMRFDASFQRHCLERGVVVSTMESHCIVKGQHEDQLLLGYGHLTLEEIASSVHLLAACIRENKSQTVDDCMAT